MSRKLYVDGLPVSLSDEDVVNLFSACGTVVSLRRMTFRTGGPSGVAEVEMACPEEADKAIQVLNRLYLGGHLLSLFQTVAKPIPPYRSTAPEHNQSTLGDGDTAQAARLV